MTGTTPVISAAILSLRMAIAAPVSALLKASRATSGPAAIIDPTPKPECKPLSELEAQIAHLKALPPHSRKRAPMGKAIYSARHDILRRGPGA